IWVTGSWAPISRAVSEQMRRSFLIQSTAKPKSNLSSTMVLPRFSICQDCAAPLEITSSTSFASRPALMAKLRPSDRASTKPAMQIWFTILVSWPEPEGPSSVTALAKCAMTGLARSKGASSPPTMTVTCPFSAPVSGGQAGAEKGQLTVMGGGGDAPFEGGKPGTAHFPKAVTLLGPSGSGQLTKMVNQICIAGLVEALSEGLNFAIKAGLDAKLVLDVISKGAAQSWQMENRGKTMVDDKFDFGFAVDWMRKDLRICSETAREIGAQLPVTQMVAGFYDEISKTGGGRWDTSSLIRRLLRA